MLAGKIAYFRPRGFNPDTAGTLNGWWDASDNATITTVSGVVSQWDDKSTNARHLTQGTAANRPGISTLNGVQCLTFNGTTQHLLRTTGVSGLNATYFVVFRLSAIGGQRCAFAVGVSSPSQQQFGVGQNSNNLFVASSRAAAFVAIQGGASNTSTAIMSADVSATAITATRVNGVSYTTTGGTNIQGNSSGITAGCNLQNSVANALLNGSIGEILWYSGSLSSANITAVTQYLAAKWGVTL
jgi:hypothetical protein